MISFIIGGGFEYSSYFKLFLLQHKNILNKFKINIFDSFMYCKWNGGRCNHGIKFDSNILDFYNKKGIGVFITFSNDVIDLADEEANLYLEQINKSNLNGVIIVNDSLRKYIRENFKNLKITRSITYFKSDFIDLDLDDYKKAEELYDYIVPRRTDVLNPDFYNNIDKSKYEITVTSTCQKKCPKMHLHYSNVNKYNRGEIYEKISECILDNKVPYHLDINKLVELGFENFKISSRSHVYDLDVFKSDVNGVISKIQ
jgi:hypothetical protein